MSAPLFVSQQLLRGQAASTLRRASPGVAAIHPSTSASVLARSLHAQPNHSIAPTSHATASSKRWPLRTLGGGLMAAGGGWYYLGNNEMHQQKQSFSVYAPLESEAAGGSKVEGSSTLLRPASPAAPRRQTVTLVFVTSQSTGQGLVKSLVSNLGGGSNEREKWFPWIGYFREAGYDCLQMNLALPSSDKDGADTTSHADVGKTTARLADELHSQIRLSNLQRQPVLFVHHTADSSSTSTAQIVSSYIEPNSSGGSSGGGFLSKIFGGGGMFSARPAISGLVVISDLDDASALTLFGKHPKLNTLIVANGGANTAAHQGKVTVMDANGQKDDKIIKDIERWLIKEGYEG